MLTLSLSTYRPNLSLSLPFTILENVFWGQFCAYHVCEERGAKWLGISRDNWRKHPLVVIFIHLLGLFTLQGVCSIIFRLVIVPVDVLWSTFQITQADCEYSSETPSSVNPPSSIFSSCPLCSHLTLRGHACLHVGLMNSFETFVKLKLCGCSFCFIGIDNWKWWHWQFVSLLSELDTLAIKFWHVFRYRKK